MLNYNLNRSLIVPLLVPTPNIVTVGKPSTYPPWTPDSRRLPEYVSESWVWTRPERRNVLPSFSPCQPPQPSCARNPTLHHPTRSEVPRVTVCNPPRAHTGASSRWILPSTRKKSPRRPLARVAPWLFLVLQFRHRMAGEDEIYKYPQSVRRTESACHSRIQQLIFPT